MNIGTEYAVGYGYDNLGRFSAVTSGSDTFTYSYLQNSNLISGISCPNGISVTKSYEPNRDLVTSVENKYGATTISKYDYSNDDLGRRTSMGKSGTSFAQTDAISYGYNSKSEVTGAVSSSLPTYNYLYNFDEIGNRLTSTTSETGSPVQISYTSNNLNQYSLINDGTPKTPSYDFDGNMTNDGTWTFTWDAENRMSSAANGTQTLQFKYDYMSRRVEKTVVGGSSERYVYDGYLQVEKLNAQDSNAILKKHVWEPGGNRLLSSMSSTSTLYALGDANKNITEYVDASGVLQAHFEYGLFGQTTVESGANPSSFDFRFSSEYHDDETSLVYYNYRYYSPTLGRWLSREPLGEKGNYNLFEFTNNAPLLFIDENGLAVAEAVATVATWDYGTPEPSDLLWPKAVAYAAALAIDATIDWWNEEEETISESESESKAKPTTDVIPIPEAKPTPKKKKACLPCIPPAGTLMYLGTHGTHSHAGLCPHYHHYKINQSTYPACKCHTNKASPDYGSTPAGIPVVFYPTGGGSIP